MMSANPLNHLLILGFASGWGRIWRLLKSPPDLSTPGRTFIIAHDENAQSSPFPDSAARRFTAWNLERLSHCSWRLLVIEPEESRPCLHHPLGFEILGRTPGGLGGLLEESSGLAHFLDPPR